MHPVLQQLGHWLDEAFEDVRINSVGHVVVHLADDPPFMLGVEDAGVHGVIADLHVPFLTGVRETTALFQIVAMNQDLAPLGHVRTVPESESGETCLLELRYRFMVAGVTQNDIVQLGLRLSMIAKTTRVLLQPACGGFPVTSS